MILVIASIRSYFDKVIPNASAAAMLSQIQEPIEVIDLNFDSKEDALSTVDSSSQDMTLITCMVDSYGSAMRFASDAKLIQPNTKIAIGGPHVTLMALSGAKFHEAFDYICVGECEEIIPILLHHKTDSLGRNGARIIWNEQSYTPLFSIKKWKDSVPNWDRILRPEHLPLLMIEGSRGCPFRCDFCSHSDISGSTPRFKPVRNIINEISYAFENYGISFFRFTDSQLSYPKRRFEELCKELQQYKQGINASLSWVCFARLRDLDPKRIEYAAAAGCMGMFLGIESPKMAVLKKFKKHYDKQLAKESISRARELGILIFGNYIFGLPGDEYEDWRLFAHDILDLNLQSVNVNPFFLAPHSTYAKNPELFGIEILIDSWINRFHEIYAHKQEYFRTSKLTQNEMADAVKRIQEEITKNGVIWNLKDYHLLAWKSLGGTTDSLCKIWNNADVFLDGYELSCLLEMRNRGSCTFPDGFQKYFKQCLDSATKRIANHS